MKKILLLLLMSVNLVANDLYLYDANEQIEITEVINNKLSVLNAQINNTFTLTNSLNINTQTNSTATYVFPYRIAIHQRESTSTYFNQTSTEYDNNLKLPEVVKVKDAMFNFTSNGELYCVSESATTNTILTSLCSVVFNKTSFFIKSGDKYTQIYVVGGNATVLDSKSKKKKDLKEGDYLVVTPQVILNAREATVTKMGNSFSIKEVEDEEKDAHNKSIQTLKSKLDNTLFVNYGQNIFGFKLK